MSEGMLAKGYEPHAVEKKWYDFWIANKMFAAAETSDHQSYSIVIPPPNVTGVLHMGHALNVTMQDIMCRYRRLLGDNVLWMPGTDHAGIATQNVVEKKLAAEGSSRHELGRERFIDEVWKWKKQSGSAIINQLMRLGASCDWQRERFTMDEGLSRAVRKVFVQLYEEGLVYRGNYIINWCPRCCTALADLEVEHEELDGNLYHIRYPFIEGSKDGITVATTRPETMLGDTALAVHPDDERYADLGHDSVNLPLMNRKIPIIRDTYVDTSFGTGGLKVTPAHDPNDFEIGVRHNLPSVKVIGDNGEMTPEAGRFEGMDRFACRKAVLEALREEGLLERIEPIRHGVGHCYRCHTVIEPNLSKQWFVRAKPLAEKAIAAVKTGRTRIIPSQWESTYFDWLDNIRDWCISRQIWWGHRIPAWTCESCSQLIVAMTEPKVCTKCGSNSLRRENDVLDTWFSSALWPFSTMGWPDHTPLLATFYPTSVLVTGFDILFFWVARMMMMGIHFMGDVPFKDVYVHALVRDEDGQKMSKSKGNVIDPLTVIEHYGTDAFRFTLAAFAAQGRDIKMSEKRVEGYRHFVNKLWNAARFSLMHLDNRYGPIESNRLSLADRWILSSVSRVARSVATALDEYRFNEAAGILYKFVWHEFCDWYLEIIKPALYEKEDTQRKETAKAVLYKVLADTLVLLHPFIPFVTEEIWNKLPGSEGSIMLADYPATDNNAAIDIRAEENMALLIGIVTGIRNVRGEMKIAPSRMLSVIIQTPVATDGETISAHTEMITNLARLENIEIRSDGRRPNAAATVIHAETTIFVSLEGIVDFNKERERLEKEIAKVRKELDVVEKKLANKGFLGKAPAEVVADVKDKQVTLSEKAGKLETNLDMIRGMEAP